MERTLLFVYGSLKRGFRHADRLSFARFLGETQTERGYFLCRVGEYPALVAGGASTVCGELYEVSHQALEELDRFEGCPDLYQRSKVRLANALSAEAYTITLDAARGFPVLPSGLWSEPNGRE